MDVAFKVILINLPLVAILAWWINRWIERLYEDFRKDRHEASDERADLRMRVKRIEEHLLGDNAPTLAKRPEQS